MGREFNNHMVLIFTLQIFRPINSHDFSKRFKEFSDVIFVHADVYADETATTTAPAVEALNLTFEPVLWVTDTSGVITHRFEGVWHASEVRQVLA